MARRPVTLGRITGVHGVRGWVRVHSYTEPRRALLDFRDWLVGGEAGWQARAVAEAREHGKTLVVRFAGIDDRDTAAGLVGADVAVERDRLPETAEGEYYWADLEGLAVRHRDGRLLGRVRRMIETGAHDVMEVRDDAGGEQRELLIPFVPGRFVLGVDLEAGVIDVDWEWD